MRRILTAILVILNWTSCLAQFESDSTFPAKWKDAILKDENLNAKEGITTLQQMDLSYLLECNPNDPPLGYIGDNYERFEIYFTSVKKVPTKTNQYFITGKTRVKQNICDFKGAITLTSARYYIHKSDYGNYPDSIQVGLLMGTYYFEEDISQPHAGKLQGFVAIRYYVDPSNKIYLDEWNASCDSYYNQQYVGTWMTYDGRIIKRCNWGSYRIPACGDLDVGKKEFIPDVKYKANGWEQYPSLLNTLWWK